MDKDDPIRCRNLLAVQGNYQGKRGIAQDLLIREQRIELFPAKVVDGNSMTGFTERGCRLILYRVVKRARVWMGENGGDLHGPSHFLATALKNV